MVSSSSDNVPVVDVLPDLSFSPDSLVDNSKSVNSFNECDAREDPILHDEFNLSREQRNAF